MKSLLFAIALLCLTPAFGCWQGGIPSYHTTFGVKGNTEYELAGLLLNADKQNWKILFDDVERSTIYVSIGDVLESSYSSSTDPETGETTYGGGTSAVTMYWNLYVYEVTAVSGDTVTVGGLIRTLPLTERIWESVSTDGTATGTILPDGISPATALELVEGHDRVLCSLTELKEPTVTLSLETFYRQWQIGDLRPTHFDYHAYEVRQLLIEKIAESEFSTVTTMDFSRCSFSQPGTVLPLTPRATIGTVDVVKRKYRNPSVKYRLRSAAQHQIMVVSSGATGDTVDTQSYTVPVTAASLVIADSMRGTDTYKVRNVRLGTDQPVFGRYSVNPEGVVAGDELTCRLVLTADGIDSDAGDGKMLVVTPPVDATKTITVSGVNRPER